MKGTHVTKREAGAIRIILQKAAANSRCSPASSGMLLLPAAPPAPPLSASKLSKGKPYAIQLNGFNRKVPLPVRLRRTVVCGISGDVDTFTQYSGYLFNLSSSEADSLTEYDVSRIGAIYRNRPLVLIRRLFQIATTLGKWLGLRYIDGLMERSDQMFEVK